MFTLHDEKVSQGEKGFSMGVKVLKKRKISDQGKGFSTKKLLYVKLL